MQARTSRRIPEPREKDDKRRQTLGVGQFDRVILKQCFIDVK